MNFKGRKSAIVLGVFILLATTVSGALSIETFDQELDINTVSPDSQIAQVVKVTDAQDQQVNQSVLLNASGNEFQFRYSDNYTDMNYLRGGYYYALFDSGTSVNDIEYRVIDRSLGGGGTKANESLVQGQLDVDIQSNYTGRYEAGEDVQINVTVENTGNYFAADVDDSGDVTEDDILVVDNGGSGTFSKTSDDVLAGQPPPNGVELKEGNPWRENDGGPHQVAMYDSEQDDDWDPSEDSIVRDFNSGGTVSRFPDDDMNRGNDDEINTEPGQELNPITEVPDNLFFPSSTPVDGNLSELFEGIYTDGQEVVRDNDGDNRFTTKSDPVIAGVKPENGESITFNNSVPPRMRIVSYDETLDEGSFNSSEDSIFYDRDNDSVYTAKSDEFLIGNGNPSEGDKLEKDHVEAWNDGNDAVATDGDLEIYDMEDDDNWDDTEDLIWIESGKNKGYQDGEDEKLVGTVSPNVEPTQVNSLFSQWENVSAYDEVSDNDFNQNSDRIIFDYNSGGTYSEEVDTILNGSVPENTASKMTDGFPSYWNLDVIEGGDSGGEWNSNQDTILRDRYQGGTYSAQADEIVNSGGSVDSDMGTPLNQLSASPGPSLMWSDVDSSGAYDAGDEIFRDSDLDDQYTNRSDQQLAGLSPKNAGEGADLSKTSIDTGQTQLLFYDKGNSGVWDPKHDAIVHDTDQDGFFTGRGDRVIEGDPSLGENGDTLIPTEPPEISAPDVEARVTVGTNTTGPLELARTESGTYTGEISIPDVPDSSMLLQATAETPISNMRGMESRVLMTRAQGIGFDTNTTSIDLNVQKRGNYIRSVRLDNLLSDQNTVNISISESVKNMTSSSVNRISLEPEGNSSVQIDLNISEMQDSEGEIVFTEEETGISQNVDVSIDTPECLLKNEQLCVQNVGQLSATADQRENISMNLDILNVGLRGSERDISTEVSGNVSEFMETENVSAFNDSTQMNVDFVPTSPGNYTGTLGLQASNSELEIPLDLTANFERLETSVDVTPTQIDLGAVPEGNDATADVMIENTGNTDIVDITFSSSSFSISKSQDSGISEGESRDYTLTFSSVSTVSGEVELTASSEDESVSRTISVSGSTVTPITQMKNEISNRVSTLRRQANSTTTLSQLTDIETQRSSIQTSWDKGNYAEAQSKYRTALSDLNSVESQIGSSGTGGTGGTGGAGGSDTGQTDSGSSGGGAGILILIILLIIVLGVGFVFYTSYIPEEGDPLYDVLGEE